VARRPVRAAPWWRLAGWRREALLFALVYLAYQGARGLSRGSEAGALADAHRVAGAERALGLNVEGALQQAFLDTPWLTALDWVYLAAQSASLAAGIIFVYRARRSAYRVLRTTLLATWVLALPVYALFPTAPPRLAGLGLADSVSAHTPAGGPGDRQPLRDRRRRRPDHDRGRPRRRPADRAARAALRPRRAAGAD
jgi:hypothetical protein